MLTIVFACAESGYAARRSFAIPCSASAFVEYGLTNAAATLDFTQGVLESSRPVAIAKSTASLGVCTLWAGRLWQSRQLIVRTWYLERSSLKSGSRYSDVTPFLPLSFTTEFLEASCWW